MKLVFTFLLITVYQIGISQISSRQPDSLYKVLKVKLRITNTESKFMGALDKAEAFDVNGKITDEFWFDKYPTVLKYEFTYVYDSIGRLIEQVQQAKNGRGSFNPDLTQKGLSKLIVKYAYNLNNKLSDEYAFDTTGRLRTQVSYDYNIGMASKYFFDSIGTKILSYEQYFDKSLNIYKTCDFQSSGDLINCRNWKFEYNKNGRLKKKFLMESKLEVKYNYLPNGLLSSVENIGFNKTIERYTYDYWK